MSETFTTEVIRIEDGMKYHALLVPKDAAERLLQHDSKRIILTIDDAEYRRAIQSKKDGRKLIVIGGEIIREHRLETGRELEITVETDPNPDFVEICEEFAEVLEIDNEARLRWESLTTGMQRSLAIYFNRAKRSDTRIKRSLEIAEKLRTRTLHGD